MTPFDDPNLRRFWFPAREGFGVGVTAFTRAEALALAEAVASQMRWTLDTSQ